MAADGEIEALFSRQDTRLQSDTGLFTSNVLFAIKLDTYQLGGSYLFGEEDAKVRPYIGLGLGISRLVPEPDNLEAETRFSASLAGGVKVYVGAHFGFRAEVRGFFTVIDSESRIFCGSGSTCIREHEGLGHLPGRDPGRPHLPLLSGRGHSPDAVPPRSTSPATSSPAAAVHRVQGGGHAAGATLTSVVPAGTLTPKSAP